MFNAETGVFAANKVLRELGEAGKVGRIELNTECFVKAENVPITDDGVFDIKPSFSCVLGNAYTVKWNGVEYICVAFSYEGATVLGNLSSFGGDDTGEPFVAVVESKRISIMPLDGSTTCTIEIWGKTETIHPIDPKFLPNGAVPVVIDFDELGLSNIIFSLFAAGGGEERIDATDAIRDIFSKPYNGNVVCKVSLDERLTMYMHPMSARTHDGTLSALFMEGYITIDRAEVKLRVTFASITRDDYGSVERVSIVIGILSQ